MAATFYIFVVFGEWKLRHPGGTHSQGGSADIALSYTVFLSVGRCWGSRSWSNLQTGPLVA